jgi:hypothetical protein
VICLNVDWASGFNGMDIEMPCRFKPPAVFMIYQDGNIDKWVRTWVDHAENPNDFVPGIRYEKMIEAFVQLRQGITHQCRHGSRCSAADRKSSAGWIGRGT